MHSTPRLMTTGLLGDYAEARALCRQALSLHAEVGYRRSEGISGTAWATRSTS